MVEKRSLDGQADFNTVPLEVIFSKDGVGVGKEKG
jgi:hypothetical protein